MDVTKQLETIKKQIRKMKIDAPYYSIIQKEYKGDFFLLPMNERYKTLEDARNGLNEYSKKHNLEIPKEDHIFILEIIDNSWLAKEC